MRPYAPIVLADGKAKPNVTILKPKSMLTRLLTSLRRRRMKLVKPFGGHLSADRLRVSLCDTNGQITDAWLDSFYEVEAVEIVQGDLLDLDTDALVSPANSFGDMSGGIDKRIDDFYRGVAQQALTERIRSEFYGELPVGMAMVVPMRSKRFPWLIAAPTMRTPGSVAQSLHAYLAMRAVGVAILRHNRQTAEPIRSVAVFGLCTGVGGMAYGEAARQMRAAYDNIIGGGWEQVIHPALAPLAFCSKRTDL